MSQETTNRSQGTDATGEEYSDINVKRLLFVTDINMRNIGIGNFRLFYCVMFKIGRFRFNVDKKIAQIFCKKFQWKETV